MAGCLAKVWRLPVAPSLSVRHPDGHLQSKACSSLGKEEWCSWRRLHQRLVSSAVGGVVEVLRVLLYRLQSRLEVAVDKGRDAYVRVHFLIQAVYTMSQEYTWCCPYTSRTVPGNACRYQQYVASLYRRVSYPAQISEGPRRQSISGDAHLSSSKISACACAGGAIESMNLEYGIQNYNHF